MPFVLSGERGRVQITALGVRHNIDFSVDHIQQKPAIEYDTAPAVVQNGTAVRMQWPLSPKGQT